jgi:hypothetical protein
MTRLQCIAATKDEPEALRRCLAALGGAPAAPAAAPALPRETLDRIANALTPHLGPIARRLVEREARAATSSAKLIEALALQIPGEKDRAAFRKAAG